MPEAIRSATEQPCFHTSDKGMAAAKLISAVHLCVTDLFCGTCVERDTLEREMSEVSLTRYIPSDTVFGAELNSNGN